MSDKLALLAKCRDDFEFAAKICLKVRDKAGEIVPFEFNDAQRVLHQRLEQQREEKGWIRALVLKGRQQGISTYTAARYYHRASMRKGVNVYILAHEQTASDTLFGIVDRYQRNNVFPPHIGTSNIKELEFDKLDSSYAVATAGTKAGGRSKAISLFHGSEVAFWANAPDHFAASVQGVPLAPNTEIILESTSNGGAGEFYERWQQAETGLGDYIPIFIPWWLSSEYTREPSPGFELSADSAEGLLSDQEYADTYKLSLAQMFWRDNKIKELRSDSLFRREYPATPNEAWTNSDGVEPFIPSLSVVRARRRAREAPHDKGSGPLIIGVDPASMGGDRFAIAARRGMRVLWVRSRNKIDTHEGTAWILSLIDEMKPARVNIDAGHIGGAIITNLKAMGPKIAEIVRGVDFGSTSQAKHARPKAPGPKLRRDEMWTRLRDWLALTEGAMIPDDEAIQSDLISTRQKHMLTNDIKLESKSEMKARKVRSPDLADAMALTFASNEFFEKYTEEQGVTTFGQVDTPRNDGLSQRDYIPSGPTNWMAALCVGVILSQMLLTLTLMAA